MKNTTKNQEFNTLLDLCITGSKIKGIIQKSILDILSTKDKQKDFEKFINSLINDQVLKSKVAKFQNNLNLKETQELHFDIGEGEKLTEVIKFKRNPKSTLPQSERPFIFITEQVKEKKVQTLAEAIEAFKAKVAKEFDVELFITDRVTLENEANK